MEVITMTCAAIFFFQAEDGIRDYKVTGVQTCALPILDRYGVSPFPAGILRVRVRGMADQPGGSHSPGGRPARHELPGWPAGGSDVGPEIGRASCRERG